ncbi:MAG: acyl-CoA thioesterase [Alphaproteobacteria bacterium]
MAHPGSVETYRGTVYPWECDQNGHLNVHRYVAKFDEATWVIFAHLGVDRKLRLTENRSMMGLSQNIVYRRELFPGDVVGVRTRLVEMTDKRLRMVHTMYDYLSDDVVAEMELHAVHVDLASRKSQPFPPQVAAKGRALLEGGQA